MVCILSASEPRETPLSPSQSILVGLCQQVVEFHVVNTRLLNPRRGCRGRGSGSIDMLSHLRLRAKLRDSLRRVTTVYGRSGERPKPLLLCRPNTLLGRCVGVGRWVSVCRGFRSHVLPFSRASLLSGTGITHPSEAAGRGTRSHRFIPLPTPTRLPTLGFSSYVVSRT